MLLYHGSPASFCTPSLRLCKPYQDFGQGFYLALHYPDAAPMAVKNSRIGYVYTYQLSNISGLNVLTLEGHSESWLSFVVSSRLGSLSEYDLVIGQTAGGGQNLKSHFSKLRQAGVPPHQAADVMKSQLTRTKLGIQYGFLTQKALSKLTFVNIEQIEKEAAL